MATFDSLLANLNYAVIGVFGSESITYQQRAAGSDVGVAVQIQAIPIDPLRLENLATGNYAVRWVRTVDLIDAQNKPFTPSKGDLVTVPNSTVTTGGSYKVIQVQEDIGGGVRLILERQG